MAATILPLRLLAAVTIADVYVDDDIHVTSLCTPGHDECEAGDSICGLNMECIDEQIGYQCKCKDGYESNGTRHCAGKGLEVTTPWNTVEPFWKDHLNGRKYVVSQDR